MTDDELLAAWSDCSLPLTQWTHRAHVRVAYILLDRLPFDEALSKARAGIQKFNAHNSVPETATSGYNETTTHAFMHIIAAVKSAYAKTHPVQTSDEFCDKHPQLMSPFILRMFYSPQQRMHPDAKQKFIEPDLAPLPRILSER